MRSRPWSFTVHNHPDCDRSAAPRWGCDFGPEGWPASPSRLLIPCRFPPSWLFRTTTNGPASLGRWWRSAPTEQTAKRKGRWSCRPRGRGGRGGEAAPAIARTAAFPHRVRRFSVSESVLLWLLMPMYVPVLLKAFHINHAALHKAENIQSVFILYISV